MSWLRILGVAALTAIVSGVLSGVVASMGVDWYHVSSSEGESGYLVIFIILAGMLGGFLFGAVAASVLASTANAGFGKALGYLLLIISTGAILTTAGLRAMADIPPTLEGKELMLMVEVRWPATQLTSPANDRVVRMLELGILSGNVQRLSRQGPLWMDDARKEEGRWIVPGAVELFTNRGRRVISVSPSIPGALGLMLPMNGTPATHDRQWSMWLPRANSRAGSNDLGFSYRYKVITRDHPSRSETIGAFQVDTIAANFFLEAPGNDTPAMTATAEFEIRYQRRLLTFDADDDASTLGVAESSEKPGAVFTSPVTRVQAVATLPGLPPAVLIRLTSPEKISTCRMLADGGSTVIMKVVARCDYQMTALPLADTDEWRNASKIDRPATGRIDRVTFMHPGSYLFANAIFDNVKRVVRPVDEAALSSGFSTSDVTPPLGNSADKRSIVRVGEASEPSGTAVLQDFDTETNTSYLLPIDRLATRFAGSDAVDPAWLNHYYHWRPDADGHDRLVARTDVEPLPYRGVLSTESSGNMVYHVQPAGIAMCAKLIEFLRSDFAAQHIIKNEYSDSYETTIEGIAVNVFVNASDHQVGLYLGDESDKTLVRRIGEAFNAVLATGKYDPLFEPVR